jgi:hypothetical protein
LHCGGGALIYLDRPMNAALPAFCSAGPVAGLARSLVCSLALLGVASLPAGDPPSTRLSDGAPLNLNFEAADATGQPAAWQPRSIGVEAQFALDETVRHEGRRSARIVAPESTRSYFCSRLVPVAPGERIGVSAWVRTANVPPDKGTVILIASFMVAEGAPAGGPMKIAVAAKTGEWEHIGGTVTAPPRANFLQVRCGFSYSHGICWWDDVQVRPEQELAARLVLNDGRLLPENGRVAVEVLNRAGRREPVTVRLACGKTVVPHAATLSGEFRQRVEVPAPALKRGRQNLTLELVNGAGQRLASTGEMSVVVPPPLTLAPVIPTHWVREDGPPRFEAEAWVALGRPVPDAIVVLRVLDEAGRECAVARQPVPTAAAEGATRFQVSLPAAGPGSYRVVATVEGAGGEAPVAEQTWSVIARAQARVTLNAAGYPVADGRVLFPLGMFNNTAKLEESAAAGFNLVHMYNAARVEPGTRPDDQNLKNQLDRAERLGLHVLLLVPMEFAFAGQWEAFTRRIRMFRNHPALLAWDEEEGLARGDMKRETLREMRRILQAEDPHHPFMVGDAHDVITRVTDRRRMFPEELMDLGMWWWYPFPLKARAADALEGTEAGGPILEAPAFLTQRQTRKPVWVGVQSYRKPGATERYPTPDEYRAQAYLAVLSDARGLMWYGGSVTGGLFLNPKEGHWDELKALVRELSGLTPLLVTPPQPAPVVDPATPTVSAGWRRADGHGVLIIVNRGPQPWQGSVRVPGLKASTLTLIGTREPQPAAHERLALNLGPYETRVLTWSE